MANASRALAAPRHLLSDRVPDPRTVAATETDTVKRAVVSDHERETLRETLRRPALDPPTPAPPARHRRAYTVVIVVAVLLAVLLLLAGSPGGAFVAGLVAGSVWLVQYFHTIATRPEQDD